jgi:hypothetical protein
MAKLHAIATDMNKAENGIWIPYEAGIELRIARYGNKNHNQYARQLLKPHVEIIRGRNAEPELLNDIDRQAAAKYILMDWKNIQDDDGKDIPFSTEKALELFRDPAYEDFYKFVIQVSMNRENYRLDLQKESEKN